MSLHPTAIVEDGAKLGIGVEIGAFAYVGPNVVLGDGCKVYHHATLDGHTTLGEGCSVFPQAVLGMPPQDLKYHGEQTTLEIGKHNVFREMVTVHPGTDNGGGVTRIGDHNLFLVGVHVAHDCTVGNGCIFANYVQFAGHVHVEDHVNIGGHSAVHHFVTIGQHAFVGGMTRIPADVPPFVIVVAARGPRSEIRMVNGVGLERSGFSREDINALKRAFMKLFSRRARMSQVAIRDRVQAILDNEPINPQVERLCHFLMRSFAHGRHGRYLESLRRDAVHRQSWQPSDSDLKDNHALTLDVVGRGSVQETPSTDNDHRFAVLELNAQAEPGWRFVGWHGNISGQQNPARITLDRPKLVTATFTQQS